MMLLQKIHKMKWLQIVISVILCFALMFSVISKSVEVKAVAGIDDAIFWAIVAALAEMGIVVTLTDPEVREAVSDFFWSCTDTVRDDIGMIAAAVKVGYSVYYNASVEAWSRIANAISEWFTTERYPQNMDVFGTVSVSNNIIDFYSEGSVTFTLPDYDARAYNIVHFYLNGCTVDVHINIPQAREYALWGYDDVSGYSEDPDINTCDVVITPNDSDLIAFIGSDFNASSMSGKTLSNFASSSSYFDVIFDGDYDICIFDTNNTKFIANGRRYYIKPYSSGYSFVDYSNNVYNSSLIFNTEFDACKWFWNLCGINIAPSQPSVYVPAEPDLPSIVIDPAGVQSALDDIAALPNDATIPVILPGTDTQYLQLVNGTSVSSVYNGDIDIPTVDGNLWKTKFPFCIPFDLINLFSGFSAEAQAPNFHVLVMPANSFGLSNDDIYWDIDFAPYNYLVQILRFFIALGFVLWLIVITRKLIRG